MDFETDTIAGGPWPEDRAAAWLSERGWLRGCNFIPSTAINQLEMWQEESFDEATIDRELGYAEAIGFNSVRVHLHDLLFKQDSRGFLSKIDRFLELAQKHHIGAMLVLFDSCWNGLPKIGKQPAPMPYTHNSGWVQSPGIEALANASSTAELREYVQGVIGAFRDDPRIHAWDLYNEPGNRGSPDTCALEPANKRELAMVLLHWSFDWARGLDPIQPLTSAPWGGDFAHPEKQTPSQKLQLDNSDVISFHNYGTLLELQNCVDRLRRYRRPILCTEFMARSSGSKFDPNLQYLKKYKIGAYCWGLVSGKTQTIFPWDSWTKEYRAEPKIWFHDIFRPDGAPFCAEEIDYIKRLTGKSE